MAVEIALLKAARPDLDPSTEGLLRRIERLEQEGRVRSRAAGPVTAGDPPPPPVAKASSGVPPARATRGRSPSSTEAPELPTRLLEDDLPRVTWRRGTRERRTPRSVRAA